MIDVKNALHAQFPKLKNLSFISNPLTFLLKKLLHQDEVNHIIETNRELDAFSFNQNVIDYFECKYSINHIENIPKSGRVVIYANHPLGALEALSLISMVKSVRNDVKIVANELLMYIEPLQPLFLPVDVMSAKTAKESIKNIHNALEKEEAVIVFPAGEVSRKTKEGIRDAEWNRGFLRFAKKTNSPLLPIHIEAENSWYFYALSKINVTLSSLLLPDQMFQRKDKKMIINIGTQIEAEVYRSSTLSESELVNTLKKELYEIGEEK